jgi:hypothetical protein
VSGQHHTPACTLPLRKGPTVQQAGWASELVRTQKLEEKSFASARSQNPVVQSAVRHYADLATPVPVPSTLMLFLTKSKVNMILDCDAV